MTTIHESFYDAVLVDRIPQANAPPTLTIVDKFPALANISWSKELNQEGAASVSSRPERLAPAIQQRLLKPDENPMELWIYRDAEKVFAGPVVGYQYQGQFRTLTLHARGLLYYLRYIYLQSNYNYSSGEDPFVIVKELIDRWQSLGRGDFGIDTTTIGTSTLEREIVYKKVDIISVADVLKDLGSPENGFDFDIDPATREMRLYEPIKGTDKSNQFVIDARNMRNYSLFLDLTAGDFATEVFVAGTGPEVTSPLWATASNTERRKQFGRVAMGVSIQGVESQATLQRYAEALAETHSNFALSFGGAGGSEEGEGTQLIPTEGMTPSDIEPGDTIGVTADLGFGAFDLKRDVGGVFADVDIDGKENMKLAVL